MSIDSGLLRICENRLRFLVQKMLAEFPMVRRWEETDDVFQAAVIRLIRAMESVRPESELHFYRLAALQIRRVLLDLSLRYSSRASFAANHDTGFDVQHTSTGRRSAAETDVICLETWAEFHRVAGDLPHRLQEAFDLVWYGGRTQVEAAEMLGISERTFQRHWRKACLEFMRRLDGEFPID